MSMVAKHAEFSNLETLTGSNTKQIVVSGELIVRDVLIQAKQLRHCNPLTCITLELCQSRLNAFGFGQAKN